MEAPEISPAPAPVKQTPQLGHRVKDLVSGLVGLVTVLVERMNGNLRFVIQCPSKDDGALGQALEFDAMNAEYVDDGLILNKVSPRPSDHIPLGSKVEDMVTGYVGIATTKTTSLNGCVHFHVEAKVDKKNEGKIEAFPVERLVMRKEPKIPAVKAEAKVPGAPSSKPLVSNRG